VISDIPTLFWQLLALSVCASGVGLFLRFLIPQEFSPLNKILFCFIGGLILVVLVAENLVYLGLPVRISAWLFMGATLLQTWLCRHKWITWVRMLYLETDIRALAVVVLLTIGFHGIAPIRQGLESYYGKAYPDQLNYILLAEFLKDVPYNTGQQEIGLRPWLLRVVGFQDTPKHLEAKGDAGQEMIGLKKQRIGQSLVTAEISVWSGTDAKGSYAATIIFFLTVLAMCVYAFLREAGIDRIGAGSGALLVILLPAVTRLSLNGFLSQEATLFVFPFFACLLRSRELDARSFTLFLSGTLAYLVATYSEVAPIGFCILFLGVMFVRPDQFSTKRLILMSAILLVALMNPFYLRNLIVFLGQQFYMARNDALLDNLMPKVLTLDGWSEIIFGVITGSPMVLLVNCFTIALGLLSIAGALSLSKGDRLVFGAVLGPILFAILSLAVLSPHSPYPIAKITLSILPFLACLVFIALSRGAAYSRAHPIGLLKTLLSALIVVAAAAGSIRYYGEVLNNEGLLSYVREPRFLNVCHELESIKNKRVLVFETYPLLTQWLCYHARRNDVYYDVRPIGESAYLQLFPFLTVPSLENVDFVVSRDRIVDLKAPMVSCLTLVGDTPVEEAGEGHVGYELGPPLALRLLAFRPIAANLTMTLAPGPEATTFPINFFLTDDEGRISQGEIWGQSVQVRRMNFPRGLSRLRLSVKAKDSDPNNESSFPILAELDALKISELR
jgi:hypothetical protein